MKNSHKDAFFLVFSDDYGEHPSSCQHLFQHISSDYPVLWVNTIGLRSPRLTRRDMVKIFLKAKKMISGILGSANRFTTRSCSMKDCYVRQSHRSIARLQNTS